MKDTNKDSNSSQTLQTALSYFQSGQVLIAEEMYRKILVNDPNNTQSLLCLGFILADQKRFDESIEIYKKVISIQPDNVEAHYNLGNILNTQGKSDEAITHYTKAIALKPDFAEAYNNLGLIFADQENFNEAIEIYRRIISIKPDYADAHCNLGVALRGLGQLDNAIASFHRTLEINPLFAKAQFSLGTTLLMSGTFLEGWKKYEFRWEGSSPKMERTATRLPQWTGQNPRPGDRLLILLEQGWGDKLQFSRYIPLAAERFTGGVTVVVGRPLLELFRRSFPGVEFVEEIHAKENTWQWHCPLLSLPLAFGTMLENIPGQSPYLIADPIRIDYWKSKIAALGLAAGTRKIGVAWKSGKGMKIAPLKALAIQQIAPLLAQEKCAWISLQKEPDPDSVSWVASGKLFDWTEEINDFDDTAALMMNLDLIISVDTSVVHLAGGLGLPTWLFNRHASDWRWMRGRENSPWYPSMRIFTQDTAGDWDGVVKRMISELSKNN